MGENNTFDPHTVPLLTLLRVFEAEAQLAEFTLLTPDLWDSNPIIGKLQFTVCCYNQENDGRYDQLKTRTRFFLMGHSRPLFLYFRLFNTVDNYCSI